MADTSAVLLAELLLAGQTPEMIQSLVGQLGGDPPLLLWTVCAACRSRASVGRSVADFARWLAENALQVLQWETQESGGEDRDAAGQAETCADRVAAALLVADVAALLVGAAGGTAATEVQLLGLLHNADQWLVPAAGGASGGAASCLPDWLARPGQDRAAAPVVEAIAVLAGRRSAPQLVEAALEDCRRRAAEARRRWLDPAAGAGRGLPLLAAKLARLDQLEHHFQQALEKEKLEAMAEFAAGAGHEINNPLTVIAGRAQLFLREEKDPERRRGLALVSAQAMRVYEMIADMMLFARPPEPELETIDLVKLVDRVVEEISPRAAQQDTALGRVGQSGPLEIEADGTQLAVAMGAICNNALEAIGRKGHIEISVQRSGPQVEIRVADDGPGIPPEVRPHLFDPFFSARQAGRGLGLGLAKCWRIVTNHGGRIEVDSQPGRGAAFTITLPG